MKIEILRTHIWLLLKNKDPSTKQCKKKKKEKHANCALSNRYLCCYSVYSLFLSKLNYIISRHYHIRHPSVQRALLDVREDNYIVENYRKKEKALNLDDDLISGDALENIAL